MLVVEDTESPYRSHDSGTFLYKFDFVPEYWTSFLNGFQFLDSIEEAEVALESLTLIQKFHTVTENNESIHFLSLAYQFSRGNGTTVMKQIIED
jgi:hypothetical protein